MSAAILLLSEAELESLVGALRSGRLLPPFSGTAVQRYCAAANAVAVADEMQQHAADGLKPEHLAMILETVGKARAQRQAESDLVELVWTGPKAPGISNRETGPVVRELFTSATESVLVAGYAVYQGREVFRSLSENMAEKPALKVALYLDVQRHHADTSSNVEVLARFVRRFREQEWPGKRLPEVFYDPRSLNLDAEKRSCLHAKCVVVDRQVAFVSSANFTEAAQVRNIEAGVLIRSARFASRLAHHFEALAAAGVLRLLPLGS
jgi:phosphatidylserine/phosphatidylglycerophosphate/cardiolipin synthase-like enzyme